MSDIPEALRTALTSALSQHGGDALSRAARRLIEEYRSGHAPGTPILGSALASAAYAAYRMPATYAAVAAALRATRQSHPDFAPARLLDLGGGTGAAAWAAAAAFDSLTAVSIADQAPQALALGRELARAADFPAVRHARWLRWTLDPSHSPDAMRPPADRSSKPPAGAAAPTLPGADLVTVSYLLAELPEPAQTEAVARAAALARAAGSPNGGACGSSAGGGVVLVVEPGTPAGHARILRARATLIAAGMRVLAPCPHGRACPLAPPDWCHFGARVNRSALHRRVKGADLGYEDEKFSYVAAAWSESVGLARPSRVLRRPSQRKGLVSLRLCRPDGVAVDQVVTKRLGAGAYRAARDVAWGDAWLP